MDCLSTHIKPISLRPPNVAGWKVNQEWIDSNSLSLRLRLPSVMLAQAKIDLDEKPDYDADPMMAEIKRKGIKALTSFNSDWDYFFENCKGIDYTRLFFNEKLSRQARITISRSRFRNQKEKVLALMSLPEYQMV